MIAFPLIFGGFGAFFVKEGHALPFRFLTFATCAAIAAQTLGEAAIEDALVLPGDSLLLVKLMAFLGNLSPWQLPLPLNKERFLFLT